MNLDYNKIVGWIIILCVLTGLWYALYPVFTGILIAGVIFMGLVFGGGLISGGIKLFEKEIPEGYNPLKADRPSGTNYQAGGTSNKHEKTKTDIRG